MPSDSDKILLTGVFGPFGKKDTYGEALGMQMELLNNQITRQQGIHSPRQSYWTFALYLLAENISIASTVLDFPKWKDFTRELKKGYSHVGINFIVPNVLKARRMAEYIRKNYPETKILLGGYGTIIPDLQDAVPHDAACFGDGVRWLREYFSEDPSQPVKHPVLMGPAYERIYGMSVKPSGGILLPGMGCENGCKFCITSHVFKKEYLYLLKSGRELFDACVKAEETNGTRGFSIMDENFLMNPERARELLELMTEHNKPYVFDIFSSANAIKKVGIDFLVRMGVRLLWIGVESKNYQHDKTRGTDFNKLIAELRANGIIVNASTILFQDHHDEKSLREDIDYVISLQSDTVQFMNYTPFPGTDLYREYDEKGILNDLHYRHQHGQGALAFEHPYIRDRKSHVRYLEKAFRKNYLVNGPAVVNMAHTTIRGYEKVSRNYREHLASSMQWNSETLQYEKSVNFKGDEFMGLRVRKMQKIAMNMRPLLLPALVYSPNNTIRKKILTIMKHHKKMNGRISWRDAAASAVLVATGFIESLKLIFNRLRGREFIAYQPEARTKEYRQLVDLTELSSTVDIYSLIPELITGAMKMKRITLRQLSRSAGVSVSYIQDIMGGKIKTNSSMMASVFRALGYRIKLEG